MVADTLYARTQAGEPLRTRAILPYHLVKYYKLDIAVGEPDEHYPAEFPGRLVPAFRYANGRILTESIAIAVMLAEQIQKKSPILGDNSAATQAQILQWLNILNNDLMDAIAVQFRMVIGVAPFDFPRWGQAGGAVAKFLGLLNQHLTANTYLVGEQATLADLYGAPMFLRGLQHLWGPEVRARYPALIRWFNTISKLPVFEGEFDSLKFTEESKRPEGLLKK